MIGLAPVPASVPASVPAEEVGGRAGAGALGCPSVILTRMVLSLGDTKALLMFWVEAIPGSLRENRRAGRLARFITSVPNSVGAGAAEPGNLVPILVTQQRPPPFKNQP